MNPLRMSRLLFPLLLLGLVTTPALVLAQGGPPKPKLCFRNITGLPGTPAAPTIDGKVTGDPGWNNAFRYVFENGTNGPHAAVQGLYSSSNIYLSFEVNNDATFDVNDVIVLTFEYTPQPDGDGRPHYYRIHLYPLPPGVGNVSNSAIGGIDFFTGSLGEDGTSITWSTSVHNPPWLQARLATSGAAGSLRSWNVELNIPRDMEAVEEAIPIPIGADFRMFFAILRVDSKGTTNEEDDEVDPFVWPPNAPVPDVYDIEMTTPNPNTWGESTLGGGGCGGMSFTPNDITTNNSDHTLINLNGPNTFSVNVHNSASDPGQQVRATFKIYNYGITDPDFGPWALVPVQQPAPVTVPGNGNAVLSTGTWNLTEAQKTQYSAHTHQCIYVELDAAPGPGSVASFINRSAFQNMRFGTASTFDGSASINTQGFGKRVTEKPVPGCKPVYRLSLVTAPTVTKKAVINPEGNAELHEELNQLYHAYLKTNRTVRIHQKNYRVRIPVSSYGYNITHKVDRPLTADEEELLRKAREQHQNQVLRAPTAAEQPQPETEQPGSNKNWKLDNALTPEATTPTPPQCPGFKVTTPPANGAPASQEIVMEIPEDQVVQFATKSEFTEGKTPPTDGCGCKRMGKTAGTTALIGLFALGFLASRRRRHEHD